MSIRAKILSLVMGIIIVFGSVAISGVMIVGNLLVEQVEEKTEAVAVYAMERVHRLFNLRYRDIRQLASEPALRAGPADLPAIRKKLLEYQRHFRSYAPYTSISYFLLNRMRLLDTAGRDVGKRHSRTRYWPRVLSGKDFVLDVSRSESVKTGVFHLAHRVRDRRGNPFALVVGRIAVTNLRSMIFRPFDLLKEAGKIKLDLIGCDGLVLFSSHDPGSMLKKNKAVFDLVRDVPQSQRVCIFKNPFRKENPDIVICIREIEPAPWKTKKWMLIITLPERMLLASVNSVRNRMGVILAAFCLAGLLVGFFLARTITLPIRNLISAAHAVGDGNFETSLSVKRRDEVGKLSAAFNRMTEDINLKEAELRISAMIDPLTNVFNRSRFGQLLAAEMERSGRYRHALSLIMMDIDHFKRINDAFGHQEGDSVLIAVSSTIDATIRKTDFLGRWGGEEFLALLPETDLESAQHLAEKIRRIMENSDFGEVGKVTISCGVTEWIIGESMEELLERVDRALYAAKEGGRNRVVAI